jgi:putative endonuclease
MTRSAQLSSPSAEPRRSTRALGGAVERRALWFYRLRGYRILATNVWIAGYELDLVVRRGRRLVFCEVKAKTDDRFGDPLEMVGPEKQRRLRRAAEAWQGAHPEADGLEVSFDVIAERGGKLERVAEAF